MPGSNDNKIRIVILDNNSLIRSAIRVLLERQSHLDVVGESGNTADGVDICSSLKPDIVLLEGNLIKESGMGFISSLIKKANCSRVILITDKSDSQNTIQAIQKGIVGVVLKTQRPEDLYKAIEKVHLGEVWLERSMIANLLARLSKDPIPTEIEPDMKRIAQLSDREMQIIQMIGLGLKNKQIAIRLCISDTTVRHHMTSIFRKLEVSDRLELLVYGHRFGLINSPEKIK